MLTTPKNFKYNPKKLYGLIQKDVATGVAKFEGNKLYGYLLSNKKSIFSVVIGDNRVNGIAQGDGKYGMVVKYIPKWSKIKVGDIVKTSGLDNIFFPNITVGKVIAIKNLDTYKSAKVEIYANLSNPSIFFLVADATPYLTTDYTPDTSFPNHPYPFVPAASKSDVNNSATQTKDEVANPELEQEQDYNKIFNFNLYKQLELKAPIE
jgi:rod shape-determining protein MreC